MNTQFLQDSRSKEQVNLKTAIKTSQPLSGGLWCITNFPKIKLEDLNQLVGKSYKEVAFFVLSKFDFGISDNELKQVINDAYGTQWYKKEITPVKKIGDTNLFSLHLGYGPTFAFKNIALEFLPRLLEKLSDGETINVLGASSGDTINAAHSGVRGTNIRSIFMLPSVGPSKVQRLQAVGGIVNNKNAITLLADLPFDPLQDIVKKINSKDFKDFKEKHNITSFNSINIARILAQIVYYFRAYTELLKTGDIKLGDKVNFSVPSGNFGDALAGYYARKMGLPIEKILIATNENDMLNVFLKTGVYEPPKRDGKDYVQVTNAPSMDIAKSSNFERMLFDICEMDNKKIKGFYDELSTKGKFKVDENTLEKIQKIFISSSSTDQERLDIIRNFGEKYNHGIDPHTAAGVVPWSKNEHNLQSEIPLIFLETSHVAQFGYELKSKGITVPGMDEFDDVINAMKNSNPREGIDYINISGDFDSSFEVIQNVIENVFERK